MPGCKINERAEALKEQRTSVPWCPGNKGPDFEIKKVNFEFNGCR
jgi:hypothetical protein